MVQISPAGAVVLLKGAVMLRVRTVVAGVTVLGGFCLTSTLASADPNGEVIDLMCGADSYEVVVPGNADWPPAHDLNSNRIFVPTSFGTFTGQILDENGELVDEFTEDGDGAKGQSGKNKSILDCTFSFSEVSDGSDPEFPAGYTFVGTGEVSGFVAGAPK